MSIFVLNYFFFGFSAFLISIFILLKRGDEVARRWFYFSIFVTIWAIFYAFEVDNKNSDEFSLYSARVANACSAFIPVTWLYFVYAFLEIKNKKIFWIMCPLAYLLLLSAPTEIFIPAVSPAKGFAHISEPGPIFHLHTINFFCIVVFGFYLMIRSYLREKETGRKQEIRSLFLATALGFIGGASNYSIIYFRDKGVDFTLLLSSYPFLMAYAMIKHRALDPEKIADAFQREKLAAVGLLAASINHEIKNPLFVVKGQAELLLEGLEKGDYKGLSEEREKRLEQVLKKTIEQTSRVVEIAQRLTGFSKPQSGDNVIERVNLNEVVDNVLSFVGYGLKIDNIQVEKALPPNLTLRCNQKEMEQILLNLVINASQAMEKRAGEIKIEASEQNGRIKIRMSDTGPGIPSEQLSKIFEPFYTTKETGTGLGLYVTKQLVERNKGRISVESKVGAGTTFVLKFQKS